MKINPILKHEYKLTSDGDAWGNCMQWLFAIGDHLTFNTDTPVPDAWEFRPSPLGPDEDSFVYQFLQEDHVPAGEVLSFGHALIRLRDILQAQGRDY